MPLIQVIVVLIVVGLLLYLAFRYIPMDSDIKNIIKVVAIIAVVLWLLQVFGVLGALSTIHVGK